MYKFLVWLRKTTYNFIVYLKAEGIYSDIVNDVETRFDTPNYELDTPLPNRKNQKVIGLMMEKLCGKIMKELAALRAKIWRWKCQKHKKCVVKTKFNLKIIENV